MSTDPKRLEYIHRVKQVFLMLRVWLGKILGALFGYLIAGPIGALLGLIIGNVFDKGMSMHIRQTNSKVQAERQTQVRKVFFEITFAVMGHIAKADGRISENEIRLARQVMRRMQLNPEQKHKAIRFFTIGKQANFDLNSALAKLMLYCSAQPLLLRTFVEFQYQAASADGNIGLNKQQILYIICQRLGFAPIFTQYQQSSYGYNSNQQHQQYSEAPLDPLKQAYAILEIDSSASKAEIKRAYRKQISLHHPDKLIAQGLPEQMVKIATEKSQKIHAAYEQIKKAKGF